VKNVVGNKGDVCLLTIASSISIPMLLASLQKKIEIGVQSPYQT
jgi:hypothetical protein